MKAIILISLLLLMGCKTIDNFDPVDFKETTQPINQTNQTQPKPKQFELQNGTNVFMFKSSDNCVFVVDEENITYLIDCGQENYLNIMGEIKKVGFESIDYFIATHPSEPCVSNLDKLALKFRPTIIYDSGIPSEFDKYKQFNFSEVVIVSEDTTIGSLRLIPTYKDGFLGKKEFNTLIPIMDEMIFMADCYEECEDTISDENKDIMVLANNAVCPTNSLMFIIQINPKAIITNGEVCVDVKDDLIAMDIPIHNRKEKDVQIIFSGGEYEIRTK